VQEKDKGDTPVIRNNITTIMKQKIDGEYYMWWGESLGMQMTSPTSLTHLSLITVYRLTYMSVFDSGFFLQISGIVLIWHFKMLFLLVKCQLMIPPGQLLKQNIPLVKYITVHIMVAVEKVVLD
jgi:hypothetical protein